MYGSHSLIQSALRTTKRNLPRACPWCCRAPLFAGMYEGSSLKAENEKALEGAATLSSTIPPETLAELAVQHATVTPFWWGLWVMLRVSALSGAHTASSGPPLFLHAMRRH